MREVSRRCERRPDTGAATGRNPRKSQDVVASHNVRFSDAGVTEIDVDAKRSTIDEASESALGAIAEAGVAHPFIVNLGMIDIWLDLEQQMVAEVEPARLLKQLEHNL
jgi:hypothetical protein